MIPSCDISPWSDSIKYLGVTIQGHNTRLTFTYHLNLVTQRPIGSMIKLFPLISRNATLSIDNPPIQNDYSINHNCTSWNFNSDTNIKKLQVVQNRFLRIFGDYPGRKKITEIHTMLQIIQISMYVHHKSLKFYIRPANNKNP